MSFISDEKLIEGMYNPSSGALEILYKRHFPMINRMVIKNNGSENEAMDIYQEAFIIFYEKLKTENFKLQCQAKTFLYSICRNLWLKKLTEKKRFPAITNESENFISVEDSILEAEYRENDFLKLQSALNLIGEPCKGLLEDFYLHQKSMEEIRIKFQYTNADNAKNQKYKCLQRLKKLFFNQSKETESYEA
ncbi:sigma-70 family RNA polymerase sigma factor [Sporocytophaga sp.]|uniref:RNA polymerase sigma factor n=1 Tax=Sporocytophaga sp. TaxID=2231183 RepID=UPI0025D83CE2|nr:sigma-70 family RNA polymerase sigma factor [Sporocytophaga sp.]